MKKIYAVIISIAIIVIALDQWTKNLALDALQTQGQSIPWLSWFHFTLVHNYGAAFGMFNNLPEAVRSWFFFSLPVVVLGILWWSFIRHFKASDRFGPITMGLVVGGALGNFIDRIRFGYVVDFIDWFYPTSGTSCFPLFFYVSPGTCHWPVFNIADSAISVAMGLLIFSSFRESNDSKSTKAD